MKKIKLVAVLLFVSLIITLSATTQVCSDEHFGTCMDNAVAHAGDAFEAVAKSCYHNFREICNN